MFAFEGLLCQMYIDTCLFLIPYQNWDINEILNYNWNNIDLCDEYA